MADDKESKEYYFNLGYALIGAFVSIVFFFPFLGIMLDMIEYFQIDVQSGLEYQSDYHSDISALLGVLIIGFVPSAILGLLAGAGVEKLFREQLDRIGLFLMAVCGGLISAMFVSMILYWIIFI